MSLLCTEKVGSKEVGIGKGVFIGANSIVLKGVRTRDGSVVRTGSVVVWDVLEVAADNPCLISNVWAGTKSCAPNISNIL